MGEEKKTETGGGKKSRKVNLSPPAQVVQRLITETRQAFEAAGRELSEENVRERVGQALDSIWHLYLIGQLSEACGLSEPVVAAVDEEDED